MKKQNNILYIPASSAFLDSRSRSLRRFPCCWSTSSTTSATENDNAPSVVAAIRPQLNFDQMNWQFRSINCMLWSFAGSLKIWMRNNVSWRWCWWPWRVSLLPIHRTHTHRVTFSMTFSFLFLFLFLFQKWVLSLFSLALYSLFSHSCFPNLLPEPPPASKSESVPFFSFVFLIFYIGDGQRPWWLKMIGRWG